MAKLETSYGRVRYQLWASFGIVVCGFGASFRRVGSWTLGSRPS